MNAHDELPQELRETAARLAQLGDSDRAAGALVADRVAMRTSHLLREPRSAAEGIGERLRRAWLWLAIPAFAAGAVLLTIAVLNPAPRADERPGTEVLAASLERDIDTLLQMEAMWRQDTFEDTLAVLSLDAAEIAGRDGAGLLPALDNDL